MHATTLTVGRLDSTVRGVLDPQPLARRLVVLAEAALNEAELLPLEKLLLPLEAVHLPFGPFPEHRNRTAVANAVVAFRAFDAAAVTDAAVLIVAVVLLALLVLLCAQVARALLRWLKDNGLRRLRVNRRGLIRMRVGWRGLNGLRVHWRDQSRIHRLRGPDIGGKGVSTGREADHSRGREEREVRDTHDESRVGGRGVVGGVVERAAQEGKLGNGCSLSRALAADHVLAIRGHHREP